MNRPPRVLLIIITPLILVFTLVSCTFAVNPNNNVGGNQASPTPNEATPLPSATPTVEPTKTATAVPTESPAQIASKLEVLNQARTYEVRTEGNVTCLMDTFNQACMAVLDENKTWTALDERDPSQAEQIYGHLVPEGSTVNTSEFLSSGPDYRSLTTDMFLLDWEIEDGKYNGEEVSVTVIKVGIRDNKEGLHVARVVSDVTGGSLMSHAAHIYFRIEKSGATGSPILIAGNNPLEITPPGQRLKVDLPFPVTDSSTGVVVPRLWVSKDNPTLDNSQARVALAQLYNSHPESHFTADEIKGMQAGVWPNRMMTIYGLAQVMIVLPTNKELAPYLPEGVVLPD